MLEELMLKREHFPIELLDWEGKPFANKPLIPPFHEEIVKNGIDLDIAFSVIDEAVENTLLDLNECSTRFDIIIPEFGADGKVEYGPLIRSDQGIYYPEFPFTCGLNIRRDKISPDGTDHYLIIDERTSISSYTIPKDVPMSEKLLKEYDMTQTTYFLRKYFEVTGNRGWYSHNVDFRDVFYKNLVIALNNAVVRNKYSK